LSHPLSASDSLGSLARRIGWSELRRTAPILHLPLQALVLWDLHVLFALDDWRTQSGAHAADWLDALAELDALVALGTLAHDEPAWAFPLIEGGTPALTAKALGHPLIPPAVRVGNDVQLGPPGTVLLVTGSNMAGKSTLLRSIGTNVMLANAGAPVCAAQFSITAVTLATSLRTGDSLAQGVSGYMAGLLALKEILDEVDRASAERRTAVLYLLDEILAGTNSVERRLAVREIARHLLDSHAIGALTTHDLALAEEPTLRDAAVRVHFRETVESDDAAGKVVKMSFDYRLRPGLATSTNAMALLHALGLTRPGS
jgi:DNA mismatch repair ATPase MutS